MLLKVLPNEILILILQKLSLGKRIIFCNLNGWQDQYIKYLDLLVRRIQLFYIISLNIRNIKHNQINFVRKTFDLPYSDLTENKCWLFSPFIKYGVCRLCFQYESEHILNEKCSNILLKLYYDEIYKNL